MTYEELVRMGDQTLLPIVVTTESGSREEFMKRCTETKANLFKHLEAMLTDDSWAIGKTFAGVVKPIAIRLQNNLIKNFQVPHNVLTRQDLKMVLAWGVFNAYVKGYASKHNKLRSRDWTPQHEAILKENIHEVVNNMFLMAMENRML